MDVCARRPPRWSNKPPAVRFRYSPDHKGERPRAHRSSFSGVLQGGCLCAGFERLYMVSASRRRPVGRIVPSPVLSEVLLPCACIDRYSGGFLST